MGAITIESFVFNWRGHAAQAHKLERELRKFGRTTVVNSEEEVEHLHPGWVHLGDTAYFAAQWASARERFQGEIMFHVQADAEPENLEEIFERARSALTSARVGVYEPNVSYSDVTYDAAVLRSLGPDLYEVPLTDCTCWFIHREVLATVPHVEPSINALGWGIAAAVAAGAGLVGRLVVRDYGVIIRHPKNRGYDNEDALRQRDAFIDALAPDFRMEMEAVYRRYLALPRVVTG